MALNLVTSRAALGRTDYFISSSNTGNDPVSSISVNGLSGFLMTNQDLGGNFISSTAPGSGTRFTAGTTIFVANNGTFGVVVKHIFLGTSVKGVGVTLDAFSESSGFVTNILCYTALDELIGVVSYNHIGGLVAGTAPYVGALSDEFDIASAFIEIDPPVSALYFDEYDIVRSANAIGDPHFVSFGGIKYDVMGTPNNYYNILSDLNIQCNALFAPCPIKNRTHLAEMGFSIGTSEITKITYSAKEEPTFNGTIIPQGFSKNFDSGIKNLNAYIAYTGRKLIINSGTYSFELKREIEWHEPVVALRSSINHKIYPHGILGQTANSKKLPKHNAKQGEGILEGTILDYKIKSLFDNNFIFNRFNNLKVRKNRIFT